MGFMMSRVKVNGAPNGDNVKNDAAPSSDGDALTVLVSSLNDAVDALQKVVQERQLPPFELDNPTPHPLDSGLPDPSSWYARKAIVGLCNKIIATVQSPAERAVNVSNAWLLPVGLNLVLESEPPVVDLIAEAGEKGETVGVLASKTGIDAAKLRTPATWLHLPRPSH
jgi:hypothetical protein